MSSMDGATKCVYDIQANPEKCITYELYILNWIVQGESSYQLYK